VEDHIQGIFRRSGQLTGQRPIKKVKSVDRAKAKADAMYDGYDCIITSELEYGDFSFNAALLKRGH
jgi:hypothetical protein